MPIVSIIVAIDESNAIGKDNKLLCHLPNDLKYFKHITQGHTVVMGRNTYESLPNGALPKRRNIVVTRNLEYKAERCEIVRSLDEVLDICKDEQEIFIIGGAMLYNGALKISNKLYITYIHHRFDESDTFFPLIDYQQWIEVSKLDNPADEKNKYSHSFVVYKSKN